MKSEKLELVRGSGNVFRDLAHSNADADQFKAILGAEIIKMLYREHLTVRAAHGRTGIATADFSRIRNADFGRFMVDRLISIVNRLGSRVEVKVRVHRVETIASEVRPRRAGRRSIRPARLRSDAGRHLAKTGVEKVSTSDSRQRRRD